MQVVSNIQAKRFNQHCVCDLLCNQHAVRLRIAHLTDHPLYCPTQSLFLELGFEHHIGRQGIQKKTSVSIQYEMTAEDEEVVARRDREDAVIPAEMTAY